MSGHRRRKPTRRDLPLIILLYAIIAGVFALLIPVAARLNLPAKSSLKRIEGTVQRNPTVRTGRRPAIVIRIETADGLHDLLETDFTHERELLSLKPGDHVSALVTTFGGYEIYELDRNGVPIERYEEKRRREDESNARAGKWAAWSGTLCLVLLLTALLLRKHFGAWHDSAKPSVVTATIASS